MKNIHLILTLMLAGLLVCAGCSDTASPTSGTTDVTGDDTTGDDNSGDDNSSGGDTSGDPADLLEALAANHDPLDEPDSSWESEERVTVVLNGDSVISSSSSAAWNGAILTISAGGVYELSGTLDDGRVVVDAEDDGLVVLVLDGVDISSSVNAPIAVMGADDVLIHLAAGSTNSLADAATYVFDDPEDDEPNAALYSKDDMVIAGSGTLNITARYNDGITSKDDLLIAGGTLAISAADDGIRGKDSLMVSGGTISIEAGGDGLKSDEDEDTTRGYIYIAGGNITVVAEGDGLQGETDVLVAGGSLDLETGGGHNAYLGSDESAKGLKAGVLVVVSDGTHTIDAADDGIHSNQTVLVSGGSWDIESGDDGLHGDSVLTVDGGEINVLDSYEGLEAVTLTINDGVVRVESSDDGLNAAGGSSNRMYINGGYIYVDATGDGLDCNGSVTMTAGMLLIAGPSSSGNGALDADGTFTMQGGYLAALGSSRMAETVSTSSSQNGLLATFSDRSAGTLVHLQDSSGNDLCTFTSTRAFGSLAFSSPDLVSGSGYQIYLGGSHSGSEDDGYYSGGSYTAGSLLRTFTVSSRVTRIN